MRALIVDDNEDMRRLVRLLIDLTDGADLVAEADDGVSGVTAWRTHRPDVIVLDHRLPDQSGLDVAATILGEDPDADIVIFSAFLDDAALDRAARLGIRECLAKDQVRRLPDLILDAR